MVFGQNARVSPQNCINAGRFCRISAQTPSTFRPGPYSPVTIYDSRSYNSPTFSHFHFFAFPISVTLLAVTPDPIPNEKPPEARSTAGMTTKVFKGSIWTLAGQVLPLGVSLLTTPLVIRLLGSEGYGVLILVALIPTYFSFADFGMGIASTKFASEAYSEGNSLKEARTIRTAVAIAAIFSIPIAAIVFVFAELLISELNVPNALLLDAVLALRIGSITFVVNILNTILNTPQLTRLRMDLNTLVNASCRITGLIATPIVVYCGWGISGVSYVLLVVAVIALIANVYVSSRLLSGLLEMTIDRPAIRPMLQYGGGLAISGLAAVMLVNLEKLILTKATTVEVLAFYSVAFTLASMASMFSMAMIQSLVPSFTQLLGPETKEHFRSLVQRAVRINLYTILPIIVFLCVASRPFFAIWAGSEFAINSSVPFYILSFGLVFHLNAFIGGSILYASGRTDIIAKLFWAELVPYIVVAGLLAYRFGAIGAAVAWSLRVVVEASIMNGLASRVVGVSLGFRGQLLNLLKVALPLLMPLVLIAFQDNFSIWFLFFDAIFLFIYGLILWKQILDKTEKDWIYQRFKRIVFVGR